MSNRPLTKDEQSLRRLNALMVELDLPNGPIQFSAQKHYDGATILVAALEEGQCDLAGTIGWVLNTAGIRVRVGNEGHEHKLWLPKTSIQAAREIPIARARTNAAKAGLLKVGDLPKPTKKSQAQLKAA